MRLGDLAAALDLPESAIVGDAGVEVTGVTHQADWARPGDAFVAIRGTKVDGHSFLDQAVERGAVAVLGEGLPEGTDSPVPYVVVPATRAALADAAAELAGHPSRQLTVLGITGTDGKTTTSCLARHLLRSAGRPTGLLSTIGYELPDGELRQPPAHFTTPEAPQVQAILRDMVAAGAEDAVVEASSHAMALDRVRGGDADFTAAAQEYDGRGFFMLVEQYPAAGLVITVATFVGLLFYVTSADSGALVMGNLCSNLKHAQQDCASWQRIVWACVTGLLTISMLVVGGIYALQYATVIMGLPFAVVMVLVMVGLWKALRTEMQRVDSVGAHHRPAVLHGEGGEDREGWRARIARVTNFVDTDDAERHLERVVEPALTTVAEELTTRGVTARCHSGVAHPTDDDPSGGRYAELHSEGQEGHPFVYRVQVGVSPVPTYGGRMIGDRDRYARLEVHLADGEQGYDVMGYSRSQLIHDCLDAYEQHLEFLRMQ